MTSSRPAALIVDDQPFIGMVASDILTESGFQTFHAYDARDAAAVLDEHPEIEVVVTEAQLPGDVNGLELCRQVSQLRPDVQLVLTSSDHDLQFTDVPEGARLLHKPYASGELKNVVGASAELEQA
jgi:CheY-like chemotaxis protein